MKQALDAFEQPSNELQKARQPLDRAEIGLRIMFAAVVFGAGSFVLGSVLQNFAIAGGSLLVSFSNYALFILVAALAVTTLLGKPIKR